MNAPGVVIAAPMMLMVILHVIGQVTGREPLWPDERVRAFRPAARALSPLTS